MVDRQATGDPRQAISDRPPINDQRSTINEPRYPHPMRELMQQHATAIVLGAFGLAVFLIILAITTGVRRTKRRKAQIREWAFRSGFDYQEGPMPARELAPLQRFTVDGETTVADASNVARGSRGAPVILFDLRHTSCQRSGAYGNRTEHTTKTT